MNKQKQIYSVLYSKHWPNQCKCLLVLHVLSRILLSLFKRRYQISNQTKRPDLRIAFWNLRSNQNFGALLCELLCKSTIPLPATLPAPLEFIESTKIWIFPNETWIEITILKLCNNIFVTLLCPPETELATSIIIICCCWNICCRCSFLSSASSYWSCICCIICSFNRSSTLSAFPLSYFCPFSAPPLNNRSSRGISEQF